MAVYNVTNPSSAIATVEFVPVSNGNLSFFHARTAQDRGELEKWLTSNQVDQTIVAETVIHGNPVLVTHGTKAPDAMMALLRSSGSPVTLREAEHHLQPWKMRGMMSNIGQSMNLWSAWRKPGGIATDKMAFASLNFAASYVNAKFGGQKSEDPYRLAYLKQHINKVLAEHLPESAIAPDLNEDHAAVRAEPETSKTVGQRFNGFMREHSVRIGEIGLRYMGSLAMVIPIKNWKAAGEQFKAGNIGGAIQAARNKDTTNLLTGITYLVGKTTGFFAKVPDPYNPHPSTALDRFREKYVFRLSSLIETGAAGTLAVGNFKKDKNGKRDYIGGLAGAVLMGGLISRLFAPFGEKELDKEEIFAYASDMLARVPPQNIPQAIADTAAFLSDNMKTDYGKVYTHLMTDLYRYDNIAMNLGNGREINASITPGDKEHITVMEPQRAASLTDDAFAKELDAMLNSALKDMHGINLKAANDSTLHGQESHDSTDNSKTAFTRSSSALVNKIPARSLNLGSDLSHSGKPAQIMG
ncbi:MAG TPA: hypothetical protein VFT64_05260 [Rickettsiales bacterium]|nr:hypothetical protein [Rickettsiales bacterium]